MYEDLSDSELVQRFSEGDRQAFEALCSRHDASVLSAVRHELRDRPDCEHEARQVADFLWLDLFRHPHYLSHHDYARRSLASYLADLGRQKAGQFLTDVRTKEEGSLELPLEGDFMDQTEERKIEAQRRHERWERIIPLLSTRDRARLRRVLAKEKESRADQRWRERLVHRLRRQLGLE
jgi:hypothetical protein